MVTEPKLLAEDVANHANTMVWTYTLKDEHVAETNE
jgi:hypothetical protein